MVCFAWRKSERSGRLVEVELASRVIGIPEQTLQRFRVEEVAKVVQLTNTLPINL